LNKNCDFCESAIYEDKTARHDVIEFGRTMGRPHGIDRNSIILLHYVFSSERKTHHLCSL